MVFLAFDLDLCSSSFYEKGKNAAACQQYEQVTDILNGGKPIGMVVPPLFKPVG